MERFSPFLKKGILPVVCPKNQNELETLIKAVISAYLKLENVLACGGSFMLPKDMLQSGNYMGISEIITSCERK